MVKKIVAVSSLFPFTIFRYINKRIPYYHKRKKKYYEENSNFEFLLNSSKIAITIYNLVFLFSVRNQFQHIFTWLISNFGVQNPTYNRKLKSNSLICTFKRRNCPNIYRSILLCMCLIRLQFGWGKAHQECGLFLWVS